jgi:ABC-type transport system involved in multi-copper enzyme maturation permease subunit
VRALWREAWDNPILQLELRRIQRRRWWPGRRFFLFYPVLLGVALGFGVMLLLTDWVGVQVAAVATGVSLGVVLGVVTWLLGVALPWIVPALTATAISRERELGTLDALRATLLSEWAIVWGKLSACLAQLWPGILLLVLLAPFQVIGALGGSVLCLCPSYSDLTALAFASELGLAHVVASLALSALVGTVRPLADVALHAGLGMFVSTLLRSSGMAIAAAYGAVLVVRVMAWFAVSMVGPLLMYVEPTMFDPMFAGPGAGTVIWTWLAPSVAAFALILGEVFAAFLLICGAARRLRWE